jgi:hypothetical protein
MLAGGIGKEHKCIEQGRNKEYEEAPGMQWKL